MDNSNLIKTDILLWMAMTQAGFGGGLLQSNFWFGLLSFGVAGLFVGVRAILKKHGYDIGSKTKINA